jgi:hypothetical protein
MKSFKPGFFEIGESGFWCEGIPDQFTVGHRTTAQEMINAVDLWKYAKGYNLFGWNPGSCFAIADDATQLPFSDTGDEKNGIIDLIKMATGLEEIKGFLAE